MMKSRIIKTMKIVACLVALLLCTRLVIADIPDVGYSTSHFLVNDGQQMVHYDNNYQLPRRVFFQTKSGQAVRLENPSPQRQIVVAYNYATGQSTRIKHSALLRNNDYLITIENTAGQTMAETKLEVIRE